MQEPERRVEHLAASVVSFTHLLGHVLQAELVNCATGSEFDLTHERVDLSKVILVDGSAAPGDVALAIFEAIP